MKFIKLTEISGNDIIINAYDISVVTSDEATKIVIMRAQGNLYTALVKESVQEVYDLITESECEQVKGIMALLAASKLKEGKIEEEENK